jgi:two-component system response regulator
MRAANCHIAGCKNISQPINSRYDAVFNDISLGSQHPAGTNIARCDGSVAFTGDSTDFSVLLGMASRDGAEALRRMAQGSAAHEGRLPEVVLLDLKLPKLSGIDVLRQLRADPRTTVLPVVVLTSSNEDSDVLDCYRAGANSYVRKSVDFDQFASVVADLGRYWLLLSESPNRDLKAR